MQSRRADPLGCHAHELAETATAGSAGRSGTRPESARHLRLHHELHDGQACAVDGILLLPAGGATGLVKQLGRLGQGHSDLRD